MEHFYIPLSLSEVLQGTSYSGEKRMPHAAQLRTPSVCARNAWPDRLRDTERHPQFHVEPQHLPKRHRASVLPWLLYGPVAPGWSSGDPAVSADVGMLRSKGGLWTPITRRTARGPRRYRRSDTGHTVLGQIEAGSRSTGALVCVRIWCPGNVPR